MNTTRKNSKGYGAHRRMRPAHATEQPFDMHRPKKCVASKNASAGNANMQPIAHIKTIVVLGLVAFIIFSGCISPPANCAECANPQNADRPECKYLAIMNTLELRAESAVYQDLTAYMNAVPQSVQPPQSLASDLSQPAFFCAGARVETNPNLTPLEMGKNRCAELQALLNDWKNRRLWGPFGPTNEDLLPECVKTHIAQNLLGPSSFCGQLLGATEDARVYQIRTSQITSCTWPVIPATWTGAIDDALANREIDPNGLLATPSPTFFYPEDEISEPGGFLNLFRSTTVHPVNCRDLELETAGACTNKTTCQSDALGSQTTAVCACPTNTAPQCPDVLQITCGTRVHPLNQCGSCTDATGQNLIGRQCPQPTDACLPQAPESSTWRCFNENELRPGGLSDLVRKYVFMLTSAGDTGALYSSLVPQALGNTATYPVLALTQTIPNASVQLSSGIPSAIGAPSPLQFTPAPTFVPTGPAYANTAAQYSGTSATESFVLKFDTLDTQTCQTPDGEFGKTGPLYAPALKLEWDWTTIDEKTCSPGGEAAYCDSAQFLMSLAYRLAKINAHLQANEIENASALLTYNAFLMRDGFSDDLRSDFVATANAGKLGANPPALFSQNQFRLAPYYTPKPNPAEENLYFELPPHASGNTRIIRAGRYHVQIRLAKNALPLWNTNNEPTDGQKITLTFNELKDARPRFRLYDLPFDGPLGTDVATGEPRNGYGIAVHGASERLDLRAGIPLAPSDYDSQRPALFAVEIENPTTRANALTQMRDAGNGLLYRADTAEGKIQFIPSNATPVILKLFAQPTRRFMYGYALATTDQTASERVAVFQPLASRKQNPSGQCLASDGQLAPELDATTGQINAANPPDALYYHTVFFTPAGSAWNLIPAQTIGSAGAGANNVQAYYSPRSSSRRDEQNQVALTYSAEKNWKTASLQDLLALIKQSKGCIVDDAFATRIYWSNSALEAEWTNKRLSEPANRFDYADIGITNPLLCIAQNAPTDACPPADRIPLSAITGGTGCPVGQIVLENERPPNQSACTSAPYGFACKNPAACTNPVPIYQGTQACNQNQLATHPQYGAQCSNAPTTTRLAGYACANSIPPQGCGFPKPVFEINSGAHQNEITASTRAFLSAPSTSAGYVCSTTPAMPSFAFPTGPSACPIDQRTTVYRVTTTNPSQNCFAGELTTLVSRTACSYAIAGYLCNTTGACENEQAVYACAENQSCQGTLSFNAARANAPSNVAGFLCRDNAPPASCPNAANVFEGISATPDNRGILGTSNTIRNANAVRVGALCNP